MPDETRIDPDGLRRLFRNVEEIGADLRGGLGQVKLVRDTVPAPWGNDKVGKRFAENNEPLVGEVLDGVGQHAGLLGEFADTGLAAVNDFVELDNRNSEGFVP
ncbi:hypothetical protein [Micromonospora sp. KLBMP9576]|uniref:hypothetical protein n=1 Tax=Micromonospora sp. KLBMP9576 TaxID=3424769 RepID=UPI003D9384BC